MHPLERAAAAAVQRGQLAVEVFYDAADALLVGVLDGLPAERPAWRKAYELLRLLRLPRLDRVGSLGILTGGWCIAVQCSDGSLVQSGQPSAPGAAGRCVLFSCRLW